jgi:hypothetical protein
VIDKMEVARASIEAVLCIDVSDKMLLDIVFSQYNKANLLRTNVLKSGQVVPEVAKNEIEKPVEVGPTCDTKREFEPKPEESGQTVPSCDKVGQPVPLLAPVDNPLETKGNSVSEPDGMDGATRAGARFTDIQTTTTVSMLVSDIPYERYIAGSVPMSDRESMTEIERAECLRHDLEQSYKRLWKHGQVSDVKPKRQGDFLKLLIKYPDRELWLAGVDKLWTYSKTYIRGLGLHTLEDAIKISKKHNIPKLLAVGQDLYAPLGVGATPLSDIIRYRYPKDWLTPIEVPNNVDDETKEKFVGRLRADCSAQYWKIYWTGIVKVREAFNHGLTAERIIDIMVSKWDAAVYWQGLISPLVTRIVKDVEDERRRQAGTGLRTTSSDTLQPGAGEDQTIANGRPRSTASLPERFHQNLQRAVHFVRMTSKLGCGVRFAPSRSTFASSSVSGGCVGMVRAHLLRQSGTSKRCDVMTVRLELRA